LEEDWEQFRPVHVTNRVSSRDCLDAKQINCSKVAILMRLASLAAGAGIKSSSPQPGSPLSVTSQVIQYPRIHPSG
jgi:hypothetical protein